MIRTTIPTPVLDRVAVLDGAAVVVSPTFSFHLPVEPLRVMAVLTLMIPALVAVVQIQIQSQSHQLGNF